MNATPTKLRDIVSQIITELTKRQNSAAPLIDPEAPAIPRLIATGDGRSLVVTAEIDRLIGVVAQTPGLASAITQLSYRRSV